MKLTELSVNNFRTFSDLELELNDLDVLIGANASGKSNFLDLIKFISNTAEFGLEDAIYLQGGIEEIKNRALGDDENFKLRFKMEDINTRAALPTPIIKVEENVIAFHIKQFEYAFELKLDGEDYSIVDEDVEFEYQLVEYNSEDEEGEPMEKDAGARIYMTDEREYAHTIQYPELDIEKDELKERMIPNAVLDQLNHAEIGSKNLLIETGFDILFGPVKELTSNITIYDINPSKVKTSTQASGKKELEPDGGNLSIVLRDIGKSEEKREQFNELSQDLLPFIDDFEVEKREDRSFFLKLKENFFNTDKDEQNDYATASMISDGTVNIYALILALYFENKPIIGIEEPERNIHPSLLSKVVRLMEESSSQKQIIATTHDPDFIQHVNLNNILMIKRDSDDFSTIERPEDNEVVSNFLENDIGIEELHRDNIVG